MKPDSPLESDLDSLLPQENDNSNSKTIETPKLFINKKTMQFNNVLLLIENICLIKLTDLTETYEVNKKTPKWYYFLLGLGIFLFFFYEIAIILLLFTSALFARHNALDKNRKVEKYGLEIDMNSGEIIILTSKSKKFILDIIKEIDAQLNSETPRTLVVNFEDRSINFQQATNSTIISGNVTGNVVN
ncbi:MAG: hypothetical protein F6K35_31225 [Okeania sp. SIO2H7]|nr:hypothetical protein [Okeania sp. SIO2H7]